MLRYLNILFFALVIVMNYLANALPINGKTTGELSDAYANLFVPAGITFAIWGIIYLLLAGFCVVQFMDSSKLIASKISLLFIISCVLNALWILAWHYQKLPLSLIIMLGILISLIYINLQLRDVNPILIKLAFGIYLGWICIATIANVTALLVDLNWGGFGFSNQMWAIIMIAAGSLIVFLTIIRINNPYIGLAVIWAFVGIIIKRSDDYRSIVIAAITGIVVVTIASLMAFFKKTF